MPTRATRTAMSSGSRGVTGLLKSMAMLTKGVPMPSSMLSRYQSVSRRARNQASIASSMKSENRPV